MTADKNCSGNCLPQNRGQFFLAKSKITLAFSYENNLSLSHFAPAKVEEPDLSVIRIPHPLHGSKTQMSKVRLLPGF